MDVDGKHHRQPARIVGQVDLVMDTADGPQITDFKTGQPHDYIRTDLQLQIYSLALKEQLGIQATKAAVYYVEEEKLVQYTVNDKWLGEGRKTLTEALSGIVRRDFTATPGEPCVRCEVKQLCSYRSE
jgi:CRISPR/Cas system-associated exonuclease Cas4 (RecB family)